jgi:hypothetical protein
MPDLLPPLIVTPPGRYRHFKGGVYEVIGTARHSETLEPMTVYKKWGQTPISGDATHRGNVPSELSNLESDPNFCLWVRPAAMFSEEVTIDGVRQPRFTRISE